MKLKVSEIISFFVLLFIMILVGISMFLDNRESVFLNKVKKEAYNILEAATLEHMNMTTKKAVIYNEQSHLKINAKNKNPYILEINRYQNTSMYYWADNKYCITKTVDDTELKIDTSKKNEKECLVKENDVNDILTNSNLVSDTYETAYNPYNIFSSEKYYVGDDPNNYLIVFNSCFRIVHITADNNLKIVYNGPASSIGTCSNNKVSIDNLPWNETSSNDWDKPASIRNLLEIWSNDRNINNIIKGLDKRQLLEANWYIGSIGLEKMSLSELTYAERSKLSSKNLLVGLLNVSDYMKASTNSLCQEITVNSPNHDCMKDNYLYTNKNVWLLDTSDASQDKALIINKDGYISDYSVTKKALIRPVLYLSDDVKLTGSGRSTSPYVVS